MRFKKAGQLLACWSVLALGPGPAIGAVGGNHRLFQRFIEDGAILEGGWLELQYHFTNAPTLDDHLLGPVLGLRLADGVEAGLSFGALRRRPETGGSETGLSDLNLYAKFRPIGAPVEVAFGALVKIPTAEEEEGLGTGHTDVELFSGLRRELEIAALVLNAGLRANGDAADGSDGKVSVLGGVGLLVSVLPSFDFIVEITGESKRFEGGGTDLRLTPGLDFRAGRGAIRIGLGIGLSDDAPDSELFAGGVILF